MRVILATSAEPFDERGPAQATDRMHKQLQAHGHQVELFQLPFRETYPESLDQRLALRLIDLNGRGDRLIALGAPSYLLKHPNKVTWLDHNFGGASEVWGKEGQSLPGTPEGLAYRRAILNSDSVGLGECTRLFCASIALQVRLQELHGVAAEVLSFPWVDDLGEQGIRELDVSWDGVIARMLA